MTEHHPKPKPKNHSHNGDPLTATSLGDSRTWGDANEQVKFDVQKEIVQQAGKAGLTQKDTANLLALAEVESGFNPDAATTSRRSSASGVFAITDTTAADAKNRLSGSSKIGGYEIEGKYDRFNTASNVSYGIAVYLDKKRLAHSDEVGTIYQTWNTNPDEYNKYKDRLNKHATQYEKDLVNKVWDGPGPGVTPKPAKPGEGAEASKAAKPEAEKPKTGSDPLFPIPLLNKAGQDADRNWNMLMGTDSPSSRLMQRVPEPARKETVKPQ